MYVLPLTPQIGVGSSFTVWLPISQDGTLVSAMEEGEGAREGGPYAL